MAFELTIIVYEVHTGKRIYDPLKAGSYPRCIVYSSDGRLIACSTWYYTVSLWDAATGREIRTIETPQRSVNCVAISLDNRIIVSGGYEKHIRVWDIETGNQITSIAVIGGRQATYELYFSPDGTRLVAQCGDNTIKMYSTANWKYVRSYVGYLSQVFGIIFSPDGRRIACAPSEDSICLWDAVTAVPIDPSYLQFSGCITIIAYSPDGRYIAAVFTDASIQICDAESGTLINGPLYGHQATVHEVAFLPDGTRLITASGDGEVKFWEVGDSRAHNRIASEKAEDEIIRSIGDIVADLGTRGCLDMTAHLDLASCSQHPTSNGGFGDIYRCRLKTGAEVAVKTLRMNVGSEEQDMKHLKVGYSYYTRIQRLTTIQYAKKELYAWSKCHHPNVQPLLGLAIFRDQIGMVAEWESNGNMGKYIELHPEADRCLMSTSIAEGLAYLHGQGIIHGDLKGASATIIALNEYSIQFTKSTTKAIISSRWAAPELFEEAPCSPASDVYALGMTILEAVTGEIPWAGKSERFVLVAVSVKNICPERPEAHIPSTSEQGDALWSLLESCWEADSEKRPSAELVKSNIAAISQSGLRPKDV
ncbi:Tyrosine kinase family catalytic domain protein [Ceratobasidium sp. AG-Ba]|nr:Tyrosine kinase family catalytic domain protein [Ceratobasidium sp. AG-Ba]